MRAYGSRVILQIDPEDTKEWIIGEILSIGNDVPEGLIVGDNVLVGKYAGLIIDEEMIVNHTEILAINE